MKNLILDIMHRHHYNQELIDAVKKIKLNEQYKENPYKIEGLIEKSRPTDRFILSLHSLVFLQSYYDQLDIDEKIQNDTLIYFNQKMKENLDIYHQYLITDSQIKWMRLVFLGNIYKIHNLRFQIFPMDYQELERSGEDHMIIPEKYKLQFPKGHPLINVHIEKNTDLSPESVQKSFDMARVFIGKHFPNYNPSHFITRTWMIDPYLRKFLSPNSNILKFSKEFFLIARNNHYKQALERIYGTNNIQKIKKMEKETSLQKIIYHNYNKLGVGLGFKAFYHQNPFPYSLDNKRYHTFNYFALNTYNEKVYKVPIDAGFTCPNRDGTQAYGGCIFCSARGAGDHIPSTRDIDKQIEHGVSVLEEKWPNAKKIAYFQAYSNTYDSFENIKKLYDPFFQDPRFIGIDIATRSDCLTDEMIEYFGKMAQFKDLTIEIGLQTIHDKTSQWMNRGHDFDSVEKVIRKLKHKNIRTCIHIINGFPQEDKSMMLETAKYVAKLNPDMLKIHMLHVTKNSPLGKIYQKHPFSLLSKEDYVDIVIKQLEILPPEMIIARLTGDALEEELLAPKWTLDKIQVLNDIDKEMASRQTWQGKRYNK